MARPQTFNTEEALNRALAVFWKKGYDRTSLTDLLDQMHIQRSSFYNAFGDKHRLFLQVLENYITIANDRFVVTTLRSGLSGLLAIHAVFDGLVAALAADAECKGCLMVNTQLEVASSDLAVKALISGSLSRMYDAFYDALQRARDMREIQSDLDLEASARFLTSVIISLRVMGRTTNNRAEFEQVTRVALSVLE